LNYEIEIRVFYADGNGAEVEVIDGKVVTSARPSEIAERIEDAVIAELGGGRDDD